MSRSRMSPSKIQGSPPFSPDRRHDAVARALLPAASALLPTLSPRLIALLLSALCTASAGQAPPSTGEPASASAGQPAQAVVDDYINALGGREALQRIRNRRAEGVVEGARRGFSRRNFRLYWAVPNLARVEFKEEGLFTNEGYDGAKGWTVESFGIAEELKPDALEALLNFADPIRYTRLLEIYPNAAIETDSPEAAGRTTLRATAR